MRNKLTIDNVYFSKGKKKLEERILNVFTVRKHLMLKEMFTLIVHYDVCESRSITWHPVRMCFESRGRRSAQQMRGS